MRIKVSFNEDVELLPPVVYFSGLITQTTPKGEGLLIISPNFTIVQTNIFKAIS
jgi:hypothetical protein